MVAPTPTIILISTDEDTTVKEKWNAYISVRICLQGRPTKQYLGWRRLHLHKIVQLKKDVFVIIFIPADKQQDKNIQLKRLCGDFR